VGIGASGGERVRARSPSSARSPGHVRALASALGASLLVALLVGCAGVRAPDLLLIERSGPGGPLTLLVDDQGGLHCNGARARALRDPQLIQARALQEELATPAGEHLSLAPRPGSVFAYRVRDESGSVSFADNSPAQPKVLRNLALFVLQVAREECGLPQPGA